MGRPSKGVITGEGRECRVCGELKPWSEYAKSVAKASKTGDSGECKAGQRRYYNQRSTCLDCGKPCSRPDSRCRRCSCIGVLNPSWNGGERHVREDGYVRIFHVVYGRILEHKAVMQDRLGRKLRPHEQVHHKNGRRADNRDSNLELWSRSHPPGQRDRKSTRLNSSHLGISY